MQSKLHSNLDNFFLKNNKVCENLSELKLFYATVCKTIGTLLIFTLQTS